MHLFVYYYINNNLYYNKSFDLDYNWSANVRRSLNELVFGEYTHAYENKCSHSQIIGNEIFKNNTMCDNVLDLVSDYLNGNVSIKLNHNNEKVTHQKREFCLM